MSLEFDTTMNKLAQPMWDCRQARAEIALHAGGDANELVTAQLLQSHLTDCEACRQYLISMKSSLDALQTCALAAYPTLPQRSLWPGIASRLPAMIRPSTVARFNVWVPTAAMAVACAAMLMVTIVQIERVMPFQPRLTPQLNMVLGREQEHRRDIFPPLPADRLEFVKNPAVLRGAVPVRLDGAPRFIPAPRDVDW